MRPHLGHGIPRSPEGSGCRRFNDHREGRQTDRNPHVRMPRPDVREILTFPDEVTKLQVYIMASEVVPLEIDAMDLVPVSKEETTNAPVCGCKGGFPAFIIKHLQKS